MIYIFSGNAAWLKKGHDWRKGLGQSTYLVQNFSKTLMQLFVINVYIFLKKAQSSCFSSWFHFTPHFRAEALQIRLILALESFP
jgi:hypothetical protein